MNSERTPNESSRTELLKSIANTVVNDDVYVPTDDELFTLGLDTRHGKQDAKYVVSGRHAADPVSWRVYEIEAPDFDYVCPHSGADANDSSIKPYCSKDCESADLAEV